MLQQQLAAEHDPARRERQLRSEIDLKLDEARQQASHAASQAADLLADCGLLRQRLSLAQSSALQAEEHASQRSEAYTRMPLRGMGFFGVHGCYNVFCLNQFGHDWSFICTRRTLEQVKLPGPVILQTQESSKDQFTGGSVRRLGRCSPQCMKCRD